MAATDGQIILAASRFGDITPVYLRYNTHTHLKKTISFLFHHKMENLKMHFLKSYKFEVSVPFPTKRQ